MKGEGNIASLLLFLLMFTVAITLILLDVQGSVSERCEEEYNVTLASNYTEAVTKFNECKSEGWSNWYYVVFITPIGTVIALCIKKLAFV